MTALAPATIADLKAAIHFPALVAETHPLRGQKVLCPAHDDRNPSCHIYPEGFKCYSCGVSGDAITWLELVYNLTTKEAISELGVRTGLELGPLPRRRLPKPKPVLVDHSCEAISVSDTAQSAHRRRAARLERIPAAVAGRGFTLEDLRRLEFAGENDNAVFPIYGPDGTMIGIKLRFYEPSTIRYLNLKREHQGPAWCSPGFLERRTVLVREGELNGMACWLARPEIAVMGAAGTGCDLHLWALEGKEVFISTDPDDAGRRARQRWAEQAYRAGAAKVFVLPGWDDGDPCDVAGRDGRAALRERIT